MQPSEREITFKNSMEESALENRDKTALHYWNNELAFIPEDIQFLT